MAVASPALFFLATAATSLLLLLPQGDDPEGPVVRTHQGAVRGADAATKAGSRFLAFYNLPYAKPPVGQLRFRSPQPPASWKDVRDATVPGAACLQLALVGPQSEDCLYLNVFTPELKPAKLRPVMIWIHGGGWITGTSKGYEPDFLIDQDVVVVTINYRLGALGFLSTDDKHCPGNFGLKDQVAALKWVKENIEEFGGNPDDVAIFGNSAGAASVHYHMLSPASKGLFHKAISESGVALASWATPEPGLDKARKVAAKLRCPTEATAEMVDCLRRKSGPRLILTQANFIEWFFCPISPFHPVLEEEREDSFLPDNPLNLKPHAGVPWLVGVNTEEGAVFTGAFVANESLLHEMDEKSDKLFPLCLDYQSSPNAELITKKIRDFYFSSSNLTVSGVTDMLSDGLFIWKTDESVRRYEPNTDAIYYYVFSYRGKYSMSQLYGKNITNLGVAHGDELFYLFSNNPEVPVTEELPPKDMEMVKKLTKLWTDFAKTGKPTPNNDPLHWPQVTLERELKYLDIGEKLEVKKGPFQKRIDFWKSLPFKYTTRRTSDHEHQI